MLKSELYRSIYNQLLSSGMFWLMIILAVGAVALPLYAYKAVMQVIVAPKFYTRD